MWYTKAMKFWYRKEFDAGRDWGQEEKGTTEDEMAGWHHQLRGHEFVWTPGVGDGQGGLAYCDSWGRRVRHDWATGLKWTRKVKWNMPCPLQALLSITNSQRLSKLMSIESVMPSNHLILCRPLLLLPLTFPASGSFQVSQLFTSGGQSIKVSASVLPKNIQGSFPLGLAGLISLQCITMYSCSNEDIEKVDGRFFSKLRLCKTRTIKGDKSGSRGYFQGYVRMISLRI